MALTLSDSFKKMIGSAGAEPCVMAHIVLSAADTRSFCSSPNAIAKLGNSYNANIADVTPISVSYDPIVRSVAKASEELTLTFLDDKTIREIVKNNRLKGKRVVVRLGEATITSASYADYWAGFVEDVEPNEGYISLVCKNATTLLSGTRYQKKSGWYRVHPYRVMNEVCRSAGLSSLYVNSATFSPSAAANSTVAHFSVARYIHEEKQDDRRVIEPESVEETIQDLSQLTHALVVVREDGRLEAKTYTPTASATATLTFDDIVEYNQGSTFDPTINAVKVAFGWRGENPKGPTIGEDHPNIGLQGSFATDFRYQFAFADSDSKTNYSYVSAPNAREYAKVLATKWVGAHCTSRKDVSSTATAFSAVGVGAMMFSGHRLESGQSGYSGQAISSSRLLYIMVPSGTVSTSEIISVSSVTWSTTTEYYPRVAMNAVVMDGYGGSGDVIGGGVGDWPTGQASNGPSGTAIFRVKQRGAFSTKQNALTTKSKIIDVTPIVHMAQTICARYADGAPAISIRTGLDKHDVQIGDIVQLGTAASPVDLYLEFGADGAGSSEIKLECIGKDINPLGDDAGITFTFVRARTPVVANPTGRADRINRSGMQRALDQGIREFGKGLATQRYIETGFQYTTASGLYATITSGAITTGLYRSEQIHSQKLLLHTSADNYVDFDDTLPGFVVTRIGIGSTVSNRPTYYTPIAKLRTSALSVTANGYSDLRVLQGVYGEKISSGTIAPYTFGTFNIADNLVKNSEFESFVKFGGSTTLGPPDNFSVYTQFSASNVWNDAVKSVATTQSGTKAISLKSVAGTYGGAIISDRFPIAVSTAYVVGASAYPTDTTAVLNARLALYSTATSNQFSTVGGGIFTSSAARQNKWNTFAGFINTSDIHVNARFAALYVTTTDGTASTFIDAVFARRAKPHLLKVASVATKSLPGGGSTLIGFSSTGGTNTHTFAWNGSTTYTFPESGTYHVECSINYRNSTTANTRVEITASIAGGGINKVVFGSSQHTDSTVDWTVGGSYLAHILIANRTSLAIKLRKSTGIILRNTPADPAGGAARDGTYLHIVKLHD